MTWTDDMDEAWQVWSTMYHEPWYWDPHEKKVTPL